MAAIRIALARFAFAVLVFGAVAAPVRAAPYAAIVVDARDGDVLHARSADRKLHPASLAKMMTLYLAFEAVARGEIGLDKQVRISRHAARQVPSKMGLRQGRRYRVRDLIRATAVKSANDAAVALAEAIDGSEDAFARRMTLRARQLGMEQTTFRNASGLTHPEQLSTARDMAQLGRALFYDFPQYYNLFSRRQTHAAGRIIYSTNRKFLNAYKGADGIKTGYTDAAGYNLVSSAQRGRKRIIAVVFGGKSSRSRNRRMAQLLDMGFSRAPENAPVRRWTRIAAKRSPAPVLRPGRAGSILVVKASQNLSPAAPAPRAFKRSLIAQAGAEIGQALIPAAAASARFDGDSPHAPPVGPAPRLRSTAGAPSVFAAAAPTLRPGRGTESAQGGDWTVQLGVFARKETAIAELASAALSDIVALDRVSPKVDPMRLGGKGAFRAQFTGFEKSEAKMACEALRAKGRDCLPIAPNRRTF